MSVKRKFKNVRQEDYDEKSMNKLEVSRHKVKELKSIYIKKKCMEILEDDNKDYMKNKLRIGTCNLEPYDNNMKKITLNSSEILKLAISMRNFYSNEPELGKVYFEKEINNLDIQDSFEKKRYYKILKFFKGDELNDSESKKKLKAIREKLLEYEEQIKELEKQNQIKSKEYIKVLDKLLCQEKLLLRSEEVLLRLEVYRRNFNLYIAENRILKDIGKTNEKYTIEQGIFLILMIIESELKTSFLCCEKLSFDKFEKSIEVTHNLFNNVTEYMILYVKKWKNEKYSFEFEKIVRSIEFKNIFETIVDVFDIDNKEMHEY